MIIISKKFGEDLVKRRVLEQVRILGTSTELRLDYSEGSSVQIGSLQRAKTNFFQNRTHLSSQ